MTDRTPFYNQHEGRNGRNPNTDYLDMRERREAEDIRARAEGREPNYENMPASVGTPLVRWEQMPENFTRNEAERYGAPDPVSVLPVDNSEVDPVVDTSQEDQRAREKAAALAARASEAEAQVRLVEAKQAAAKIPGFTGPKDESKDSE